MGLNIVTKTRLAVLYREFHMEHNRSGIHLDDIIIPFHGLPLRMRAVSSTYSFILRMDKLRKPDETEYYNDKVLEVSEKPQLTLKSINMTMVSVFNILTLL